MKKSQYKIWHVVKNFYSKSNKTKNFFFINLTCCIFFQSKMWCVLVFSGQNLTQCKTFYSKSDKTKKTYFKIKRFVFLSIQNLTRCNFFYSNSEKTEKFCFKIWRGVFFSNQNLTRCKTFTSKPDLLYFFKLKIWHVVKLFIQNLLFKPSFQIVAEILSKNNLFFTQNLTGRKFFFSKSGTHCFLLILESDA